jgi:hypothetical protein
MILPRGQTVNKGPLQGNTNIIHIKEPIKTLKKVPRNNSCTESQLRYNNDSLHGREKNNAKEQVKPTRLRGGAGSEGEEEDLYFVPSDDEKEETTEESRNKSLEIEDEGIQVLSNKERMKATKKTVKATQDNNPFGHACNDIAIDNDTPYVRVYCQNVSGIYDREGIGLDAAFKEIKQAGADIFTFNETHGDESNAIARRALRLSKQRMWRDNNEDCKIIHSSSAAPVLNFTKQGGNMVGITGSLVGRIRDTITDPFGRWCGYTLIGKDIKEIMVITAYNVSQYKNAKVGEDTLFNQQIALYKLNNIREPDPKKLFIEGITALVKNARKEDKDIILTGDFNELVGDDQNGMVKVLAAGDLTDAHEHQHGKVDISTYTRGVKRLDYVFVTPRLIKHVIRSGYESFHARIASDHRGYFVDFALSGFLDRQLPSIFSASSRAIRGNHPSNITKYVEHLDGYLEERDIYRKVKEQKYWYNKEKLEK